MAIINISRDSKEELPKYLYEYPSKDMQLQVKSMSAREGLTIKEYITIALEHKLKESEESAYR